MKYIRLRELALKAPECYASDFCVFSPIVLYVRHSVENFFLFPRYFILSLISTFALLKYTVYWKPDHEGYSIDSKIIKMAESFFFFAADS